LNVRQAQFRVAVRRFGPFESAIARQWAAFEEQEHTGLHLEAVPFDLHPLFDNTLAQGDGCDWDVVFVNTDWVASAHHNRALSDLSDYLRSDPPDDYPNGWTSSLLELQNLNGYIVGLPYHDGPESLIYRKDLLAEHDLAVPQTWDEFCHAARMLHKPAEGRYGTVFAVFPDGHNSVYDFCLQLWTRGGELIGSDGNFTINSPEALDALQFLREVVNDPSLVHPECRQMDSVRSGKAFADGEVAMMVNWFGFAAMAEVIAESRVKGKVAVAPLPHLAGVQAASLNIYWLLSVPSSARHKDLAWQFVRHCASAPMDRLLTLEGGIGCRRSTWQDEAVNRMIPFYCQMEALHKNARIMPRVKIWPDIAAIIDRMVSVAIDSREPLEQIVVRAQSESDALSSCSLDFGPHK
jgi:multiple sugar transport system substrate-binding protein